MRRAYRVFGLCITSPVVLPGVPLAAAGDRVDVTFHPGALPPEAPDWSDATVRPVYESESLPDAPPSLVADRPAADETLRLRYAEGIDFAVTPLGDAVWSDWRAPLTEADAVAFLLGPVLGVVLRRRGMLALHASAVLIDGRAHAFLGPGGSGKSTLAAAMARAGHPVVTEDLLALRREGDRWLAHPGYRRIRLWEDSARLVTDASADLPALSPTWDKRELDLEAAALPFSASPAPLGAVHVLEDFADAPPRRAVEPPPALLRELIANVYMNHLATPGELAHDLARLRGLAAAVPAWRLWPGEGAEGLAATVAFVARGA